MAPPTPPKPDLREARAQVQAYANCAADIGKAPRDLVDWSKPEGERRIDLIRFRCTLLTEVKQSIGRSVLEMDNYYDCRDERAPNRTEIINAAIAAYGSGEGIGFLNEILAEIDEASETGDDAAVKTAAQLGWLATLINKIKNGWPRDPSGRAFLEGSVKFSSQLVGAVADIIAKAVPGASAYKDKVVTLLRMLVDMLFFVGDFVAESEAIQKETGVRLLSYSDIKSPTNPYGVGRVQTVRGAYGATYGGGPSMATVRAWCKKGNELGKPYLAPDGTDGTYQAALALWEAENRQVGIQIPKMVEAFQGSYPRFIAANVIYAAILNGYAFLDAQSIIKGLKAYVLGVFYDDLDDKGVSAYSGNAAAFDWPARNAPLPVMFQSMAVPGYCGGPTTDWAAADTVVIPDPKAIACKENYFAPFWEDTAVNWGWEINRDIRRDKAIDYKRSIIDAMLFRYFLIYGGSVQNQWRRDDFSRDINAVHNMWAEITKEAFPFLGPTKRLKKIKETLAARWEVLVPMVRSSLYMPSPANASWERLVRKVIVGDEIGTPMPIPNDPRYATTKARCPDNTDSCLPCSKIVGRRPVGAKAIDIPLRIEWNNLLTVPGQRPNPLASAEYAAWRKRLTDNGYPGYYIDCIVKDKLVFVERFPVQPGVDIRVPDDRFSDVKLMGASGLMAPRVALLTGSNRLGAAPESSGIPTFVKVGAGIAVAALVLRGLRGRR